MQNEIDCLKLRLTDTRAMVAKLSSTFLYINPYSYFGGAIGNLEVLIPRKYSIKVNSSEVYRNLQDEKCVKIIFPIDRFLIVIIYLIKPFKF